MSCGLAIAAALLSASHPPAALGNPLAAEPLYADIIVRARALHQTVEGWRTPALKAAPAPVVLPRFPAFKADAAELAALDMKGHLDLAERKTDGDLKCILKGISEDLPKKIEQVEQAKSGKEADLALDELAYLLNDNVEVIVAPPKPPV